MWDELVAEIAGRQYNRVARRQLSAAGMSRRVIDRWVASGRLVIVDEGVLAVAPVLAHDPWGRRMAATLTAPGSVLSHASAAAAWGFGVGPGGFETITRPGNGGPRRLGKVLAYRSTCLDAGSATYGSGSRSPHPCEP